MYRQAWSSINQAAARLLELQRQVSTNKRVQKGSHDPSAAAAATVERGQLASIDVYSAAADSAKSRLLVADTVLSEIVQRLGDAQVSVLAARGSTLTPAQREARALELEALRDALLHAINTSYRGTYLFGGAAATTEPYTKDGAGVVSAYQGSTTEVSVDVAKGIDVAVAFNGEALIKGTDPDDVFVVMERAIDAARTADTDALNQIATELQRAFDRATLLQGRVGASLEAIENDKLRLSEAARASAARISSLEDANLAAAISGMTQAETVYRAALGAAAQIQRLSLMDYLR